MTNIHNEDWNHKKSKGIIDHYGYKFFANKKVLDLGCGHGDVAASLTRLGADVTCVDARQENLDALKKKFPFLKTIRADLDSEWPVNEFFDIILSLGVICHLKNYEKHLNDICSYGENIILETEVADSVDPNTRIQIFEDRCVPDYSFNGEGSILSAAHIEDKLAKLGAQYRRINDKKYNSGPYRYDWQLTNTSQRLFGNRNIWFIRCDRIKGQQLVSNNAIKQAEAAVQPAMQQHQRLQQQLQKQRQPNQRAYPQPRFAPTTFLPPPPPPGLFPSIGLSMPLNTKIRLFVNYYEDKNLERKREIDLCLQRNIENPALDIIILESDNKPTYNFFFEKINQLTSPNDINIISNADIFFDQTIILTTKMGLKDVYALSCWDWKPNGATKLREDKNSQDAWIVKGKIENVNGDFKLGMPLSNSRIAYEFDQAGYKVINPCRSIKIYQVHNSGIRHYDPNDKVPGPTMSVELTNL